jgi:hypothetical protein
MGTSPRLAIAIETRGARNMRDMGLSLGKRQRDPLRLAQLYTGNCRSESGLKTPLSAAVKSSEDLASIEAELLLGAGDRV